MLRCHEEAFDVINGQGSARFPTQASPDGLAGAQKECVDTARCTVGAVRQKLHPGLKAPLVSKSKVHNHNLIGDTNSLFHLEPLVFSLSSRASYSAGIVWNADGSAHKKLAGVVNAEVRGGSPGTRWGWGPRRRQSFLLPSMKLLLSQKTTGEKKKRFIWALVDLSCRHILATLFFFLFPSEPRPPTL